MGPIMEKIAEQAAVTKVDADQEMALAETYNVMSLPTLIFKKDGQVVETLHGLQTEDTILGVIARLK